MPEIIKIGITDNLDRRLKELDNTSTPLPFECYYALEVEDGRMIEKLLHETFDDKRVRQNREFFNCSPEQAKSALKIAETMGGKDITPKLTIFEDEVDRQALEIAKKKNKRINYFDILGINKGEVLAFAKDSSITCEADENNQVLFRGELTTLSASALIIVSEMGYEWQQVRGAAYWSYKGNTLLDLYQKSRDE